MTERIHQFVRDDFTFPVLDRGPIDGEIVVLLHGFPQTSRSWDAVAELLSERGYRTLAFDQRGYAPEARPRGRKAYRLSELVSDLVALLDEIGGKAVHLVGHDWGAAVAWSTAARYPDRVRTLSAVSVPHPLAFLRSLLSSDQFIRSYYIAFFQVPWLPEYILTKQPGHTQAVLRRFGLTPEQLEQIRTDIVESGALSGGINWYRALPFLKPSDLGKVRAPTTLVWSTGDIALGRRCAELCERYVTGPYRLEVLDGSHWIPEEQPERLGAIIAARIGSA